MAQTICICEEQPCSFAILFQHMFIMKLVHVQFRDIQYAHPSIYWLIQDDISFLQFDNSDIVTDNIEGLECGTSYVAFRLNFISHNFNIKMDPVVLKTFTVYRIVHQFEEVLFKRVSSVLSFRRVKVCIRL